MTSPPPENRQSWTELAAAVNRAAGQLDQFTAGWQAAFAAASGTIHCHRGCSNCCSLAVNCTYPEAMAAGYAGHQSSRHRLRQHVHHLADLAKNAPSLPVWLRSHRAASGGCPFLDQAGACSIYSARPLTCRALLATREPRWCAADFSTLTSEEKQAFMASLDRSVVSFPMHYVAATKEFAERQERSILQSMIEQCGFALYGSLPVLIWLEQEFTISRAISTGHAATVRLLAESELASPWLVTLLEGQK